MVVDSGEESGPRFVRLHFSGHLRGGGVGGGGMDRGGGRIGDGGGGRRTRLERDSRKKEAGRR